MRRPEWLLLPLFLLPLLGAAVFCLYARHGYLTSTDRYAQSGETILEEWMRGNPDDVRRVREEFAVHFAPGSPFRGDPEEAVGFVCGDRRGEVLVGMTRLGREAWTVTDAFPAGLAPHSVADAHVRLEIDLGAAPAKVGSAADRRLARPPP